MICCNNCIDVCLKRPKINEEEAGVGPLKRHFLRLMYRRCKRLYQKNNGLKDREKANTKGRNSKVVGTERLKTIQEKNELKDREKK